MRVTQLVMIALQAEKLRLQRALRRGVLRVSIGGVGALFAILAVLFGHIAAYDGLRTVLQPHWAALIVAGFDLVIGLILGLIAGKGSEDVVGREAVVVRDDAWHQLRNTVAVGVALRPLAGIVGRKPIAGLSLAAIAAAILSRR